MLYLFCPHDFNVERQNTSACNKRTVFGQLRISASLDSYRFSLRDDTMRRGDTMRESVTCFFLILVVSVFIFKGSNVSETKYAERKSVSLSLEPCS